MKTLACKMCGSKYQNESGGHECIVCHASGVKLWRGYGTFFHPEETMCVDHACEKESKDGRIYDASLATPEGKIPSPHEFMRGELSFEIGWTVPLIVTPDGSRNGTIWGYTTNNPDTLAAWAEWKKLPLRKES